jgi:hypothetical protein
VEALEFADRACDGRLAGADVQLDDLLAPTLPGVGNCDVTSTARSPVSTLPDTFACRSAYSNVVYDSP